MHVFARFYTFLHVFAHSMYLRYTNTCYKVLTFNSTDFLFLNTVLHTTDLIIHDFELHELFNSPKNVHLKALLYARTRCGKNSLISKSLKITDVPDLFLFLSAVSSYGQARNE